MASSTAAASASAKRTGPSSLVHTGAFSVISTKLDIHKAARTAWPTSTATVYWACRIASSPGGRIQCSGGKQQFNAASVAQQRERRTIQLCVQRLSRSIDSDVVQWLGDTLVGS